jgi:FecR protein
VGKGILVETLKSLMVGVLCLLLLSLPVLGAPPVGQRAGQIKALIPAATKNNEVTKVKDELDWNDLLKTAASGRVRAGLDDGSILSVGSNSELRVLQHDAASQQTSLEMTAGRLRSKVVKITQPNGKFEVHTPNAVIGVIGTDFYVQYDANKTTVICYSGVVSVTPLGGAHAANNSTNAANGNNVVTLNAGQMVEITSEVPPGGFHSQPTPGDVQRASMSSTEVPDLPLAAAAGAAHSWHWILLMGAFAGAAAGLTFAVDRGTTTAPPTRNPGCPVGVPPSECQQ